MMRLPKFEYHVPQTIAEAVRIMGDAGPQGAFVAGGTDLYPNMKRRQQTPAVVIGLGRAEGLSGIRFGDAGLVLGAGTLLSTIENHPRVRSEWPALAHAIAEISTPPLR